MRIEEVMLSESCVYTDSLMESKAVSRMRQIAADYKGSKSEIIAYQNPNNKNFYRVFVTGDRERYWFDMDGRSESEIKKTTPKQMSRKILELRSAGWQEVQTKNFLGRNWQRIVTMIVIGGVSAAIGGVAVAALPVIANAVLVAIGELKNFITQPLG